MEEDLKLIRDILNGNIDSFNIMMNKYEKMIFSFVYNMVKDREAAQDITQEVFITVYNKLYLYKSRYKFTNWILQISRNKAIDYMRKYKRVYEANLEDITYIYDDAPGPEEKVQTKEIKLLIEDFINKLNDIDKQILMIKYSANVTFGDIGEILTMSEGAVKRRYYKTRDKFKAYYYNEYYEKEV